MSKLDRLFDGLDSDLAWRKKEVSSLYIMLRENNSELILKSCILLLYSHWEGFVKNASKLYIFFVSKKKIKVALLSNNFKAICLKGHAKNVDDTRNCLTLSNEIKLLSLISGCEDKLFTLSGTFLNDGSGGDIIDTAGNLSYEVFRNIMHVLGIDEKNSIKTKSHYIDSMLLRNRNKIAHGNKSKLYADDSDDFEIDTEQFYRLKKLIFSLMDNLSLELKSHAENDFYLNNKSGEKAVFSEENDIELQKNLHAIFS
jgi:hypothetical protein